MSFMVGQTVGDYSILQELGKGGSGQVYKVEHTITRRREALKILAASGADQADNWDRFLREIRLQASLTHPNIASVLTAFWVNDEIALVCELLDGESLKERMDRGAVPLSKALGIMSEVLSALSYAHAHGVVHRDVSPSNIFITAAAPETVKLIDFGLAKAAADLGLTQDGSSIGTPHYMSPEQIRGGKAPDARSDVYSCGAVLFELVTGRKLFEGTCTFELMQAHAMQAPEHAQSLNPAIPDELDAIIGKSLAKEPGARFQSADSFRDAIEQVRRKLEAQQNVRPIPKRSMGVAWAAVGCLVAGGLAIAGYWTTQSNAAPPNAANGIMDVRPAPPPSPELVKPSPTAPSTSTPGIVKPSPAPTPLLVKPERPLVATAPAITPVQHEHEAVPAATHHPVEETESAPVPVDNVTIYKKPPSKVGVAIKKLNPFRRKSVQEAAVETPSQSFVAR